jgi:hypothetical protein
MKIKIFEKTHELDLQDEMNAFFDKHEITVLSMHYQVAMCYSNELEYSFSCLLYYEDT